jgi:serine/threonine-protein kinase
LSNPLEHTQLLSQPQILIVADQTPTQIGSYQIHATLGSGSMGTVYLALAPLIGRTVALKVILRDRRSDEAEQFGNVFRQEIQAIAQLEQSDGVYHRICG